MPGQGGVRGRHKAPLGQNGVAKSPHKDMLMPALTDMPIRPPEPPRWQHRPTLIVGDHPRMVATLAWDGLGGTIENFGPAAFNVSKQLGQTTQWQAVVLKRQHLLDLTLRPTRQGLAYPVRIC